MKLSRASPKSGSKTALDDASEHPEVGCVEGGMLIADAEVLNDARVHRDVGLLARDMLVADDVTTTCIRSNTNHQ